MAYRFTLEPYKGMNSRYTCPECGKSKTFTRYIDTETGNHVAGHVGKCSRLNKCDYHYTPKQYFEANKPLFADLKKPEFSYTIKKGKLDKSDTIKKADTVFPLQAFKATLQGFEKNCFVRYLTKLFGAEIAAGAVSRYFIGSTGHWKGATVFWQIASTGKVRGGKVMLYDPEKGKRVKEPFNHITWMHKTEQLANYELRQCLFGEHLINQTISKPIAIVESEKTAIIASVYLPQFIWVAVGSLTDLNAEKCSVLKGRKVTLFPDLNGFTKWQAKAKELSHITRFIVSDLLERKATESERENGLDLADYLIQFPYSQVNKVVPLYCDTPQILEQTKPLSLNSIDLAALLGNTQTGQDFGELIIQGYRFKSGHVYDVLFDKDGNFVQPGTNSEMVKKTATFFGKSLQPALFNDAPCWVHWDKRFIVNNN